jgi:hypothetical protein
VPDAMGYTKTPSWEKGLYVTTRPSPGFPIPDYCVNVDGCRKPTEVT